jgi:peptide/nickel transport system substrate-binding protein
VSSYKQRRLTRRAVLVGGGGVAGAVAFGTSLAGLRTPSDGRIRVAMNQNPATLDMSKVASGINVLRPCLENVVETLIENDPSGNIRPGLCDWTISPDAKTVEYRVRPGVRFHSGDPLTAHDVLFSHDRLYRGLPSYRSRCWDLNRVELVDDMTVRFHFNISGGTYLRTRGAYVYSKAYFDRVGDQHFTDNPVGTGPYRITDYRYSEYLDLDAFDQYWGDPPAIRSARLLFVLEDMTRIAMLRSGEADLIMAVPYSMVPVLAGLGFGQARADVHPTFTVRFQLANPNTPWADRRVRLAIAHAINSEALIEGLFAGIPKHYAGFTPIEPGYDPTLQPYGYDPHLARRLLAEAGYSEGFRMPLIYFANNYYGGRETAEAVTFFLRRVGITVEASGMDSAHALSFNREYARDPDAVMVALGTGVFANYSDPVEAMRFSYGSRPPNSWYHDPEFDRLIDAAVRANDDAAREAALRACARKIHEDLQIIPLWNSVVVYMMREGIRFQPTQRDVPLMRVKDMSVA